MSQQWMSIVEYARFFSISDMTVRRRIKTGRIPAELKDGKYYIPVDLNDSRKFSEPRIQPTPSSNGFRFSKKPSQLEMADITERKPMNSSEGFQRRANPIYRPSVETARISNDPSQKQSVPENSISNEGSGVFSSSSEGKTELERWQRVDELIELCSKAIELKDSYNKNEKDHEEEKLEVINVKMDLMEERINQLFQKFEDLSILIQMMDEPA